MEKINWQESHGNAPGHEMKPSHTPGPWKALDFDEETTIVYDKNMVVVVPKLINKANARLIAAAPEMLTTIKTLLASCQEALSGEWDRTDEGFEAMVSSCEEIISKAEGK